MNQKSIAIGNPTKEFFIDMLTRDIMLSDAILDLVDNCIDGARRVKKNKGDFTDLFIKIIMGPESFIIEDNCGGFSLDIAEKYAFRFGRPNDTDHSTEFSIGRFGIGMKRAIFKIGSSFSVISKTDQDEFEIKAELDKWIDRQDWDFEIDVFDEPILPQVGTKITITKLNESILESISNQSIIRELAETISRTYGSVIKNGIEISLNGRLLNAEFFELFDNDMFSPTVKIIEGDKFTAKFYAGFGTPDPSKAGWYIYCNDRLVVAADKTKLTGWGGKDDPSGHGFVYHNDYAMFRGFVFLDAEDPFDLPLTTTKRGLDWDSRNYHFIKLYIVESMKTVIPHLKSLKDSEIRDEILSNEESIIAVPISSTNYIKESNFTIKKQLIKTTTRIQYNVSNEDFEMVKASLQVGTQKDVGMKTFLYYFNMEC